METNCFLDFCCVVIIFGGIINGVCKLKTTRSLSYTNSHNFFDFLLGK